MSSQDRSEGERRSEQHAGGVQTRQPEASPAIARAASRPPVAGTDEVCSTAVPARCRILLVEDDEDDALLVQVELTRGGRNFEFRRVDNAEDLQRALAEETWDVVISDHQMPTLDSIEAYHIVRLGDPDIPFVILSGTIAERTALAAMRLGAHDYIDKSNLARLVPVIERELRHARLHRSKARVEQMLDHLTHYDALTGLPNRQHMARLIERSLAPREAARAGAALLHIDLHRFMRVNASLGVDSGDEALQQVACRLTAAFSDRGVVGRLGQDEFLVFVRDVAGDAVALGHAQTAIASLAEPFTLTGEEVQLACTVGIACYPRAARDAAELLRNAETAMADAKRQGPGTVRVFTPEARPAYGNALQLENALRHAIPRRELFLDYQPWIDARTGQLTGAEALVRWRHPGFGLLPPNAFIPLADETGLIVELGRWVLREACRQNRLWQRDGMTAFVIAANVSAAQFRRADFADQVASALAESGLDPTTLELEITETVVMQDAESNIGTLRKLKDMGVRIAIDDFGTGYSSLSYLKRLPIDIIKIDRSFLQGLATDGENQAIVRLIVALAKSLKLTLIAEGVEEIEQLEFLRALDCDRAQGYLISRPVVPAAVAALCHRGERASAGNRA